MRVDVFLGDYYTGRRLGSLEEALIRRTGGSSLLLTGAGAPALLDLLAQASPNVVNGVVFSLVTDDAEIQRCRLVAADSPLHVTFEGERTR